MSFWKTLVKVLPGGGSHNKKVFKFNKGFVVTTSLLVGFFAAGCSKDNKEGLEKIAVTPVPTQSVGSPTPPTEAGMPLSPMETWCESMMVKPDQEWTREDAEKFSRQCLYNE